MYKCYILGSAVLLSYQIGNDGSLIINVLCFKHLTYLLVY